ncbi:MAG: glycosyltransferase [Candidatus Dormibacteraeota bacterium]|nr:glycosyltransferase [Candidatus Dormibacteraeota bacterium]
MILEAVAYFSIALGCTTVVALLPGAIRGRFVFTLPLAFIAMAAAALLATQLSQDSRGEIALSAVLVLFTLLSRLNQRRWSWLGAQLFSCVLLASLFYLAYAAYQTYALQLSVGIVIASTVLLVVELAALALSVSYAFEIVDVLSRRDPPLQHPRSEHQPWVALQVATYNEPVDIVRPTLESLARIEYPHLIVQVVDNNTKDPEVWQPLQRLCEELGSRFQFMHLEPWPGFKAGACNEATRRLPSEVEIIGIIDADYAVRPDFLEKMVGHFEDPSVAFAQSSQNYRDWEDSSYLRGLFYSFRYFFDVTMPSRAHRNAIIFCGTMGLIRRSALQDIGGWSETCITEDAEASLRMLGKGYRGVYDRAAYGAGMMPLDFDGLKKQRFRWALGGIQILRMWWRELLPIGRHRLELTGAQRMHYLLGSLQWFGEPFTAIFTLLLLLTSLVTSLHHQLPVRQLTAAVLVVPLAFAVTGLLRATWAMRRTTGCTFRDSVQALRVWFALSWVVTLACVRGLISSRAEFLRTPKKKEGGRLWHALAASRTESLIAVAAVAGAVFMLLRSPSFATLILGVLLLFEAAVYGSAPLASVAAERVQMTPMRRAWMQSPQNTGERPAVRRGAVVAGTLAVVGAAVAAIAALVANSPPDTAPFGKGGNLPNIGSLGNAQAAGPSSSPTPSPSAATTATPSTVATPTPTSAATATPRATATPAPTPTPTTGPVSP